MYGIKVAERIVILHWAFAIGLMGGAVFARALSTLSCAGRLIALNMDSHLL